jgi:hypothetical protein
VNQLFTVPDLVIPCPATLTGVLKSCEGNNIAGTIYIDGQSGFINYQHTTTGVFTMPIQPNVQLTLEAFNTTGHTSRVFTSPAAPGSHDAGDLYLCQPPVMPDNSILLNGPSFTNQLIPVNPTSTQGGVLNDTGGTHRIHIVLNGGINISTPYEVVMLEIEVRGNSPGIYFWNATSGIGMPIFGNGVKIQLNDNFMASYYELNSLQDSGSVTITQLDGIGGRIKGYFSGNVSIYAMLPLAGPNTVTGRFDIPRSY